MNEKPKVSVIIPYVTRDESFAKMRACLAAQTWENLESIFVCDENRDGPSVARNKALAQATGEIILFADVDDEVASDWVARMVDGLGDADFAWSGLTLQRENFREKISAYLCGQTLRETQKIREHFFARVFGYRLRDCAKFWRKGGLWENCHREWAGVWRLAIRREIFREVKFDESLRLGEDALFIAELAARAKKVNLLDDAGYVWFVRETGGMHTQMRTNLLAAKFAMRDARKRVDPTMKFWRGSFVLSLAQIFSRYGLRAAFRYAFFLPLKEQKK